MKYDIWISFLECYNEKIYDLLSDVTSDRNPLHIRQSRNNNNTIIINLMEPHVRDISQAIQLVNKGFSHRQKAETQQNRSSSRSHAIFTIKLAKTPKNCTAEIVKKNPSIVKYSKFSIIDLAGSERGNKTLATGTRLREAGTINNSLLTLKRCMKALQHNQVFLNRNPNSKRLSNEPNSLQLVPFRESVLTKIFRDFFEGEGRAALIVNVNSAPSEYDEMVQALEFATITKAVKTTCKKKIVSKTCNIQESIIFDITGNNQTNIKMTSFENNNDTSPSKYFYSKNTKIEGKIDQVGNNENIKLDEEVQIEKNNDEFDSDQYDVEDIENLIEEIRKLQAELAYVKVKIEMDVRAELSLEFANRISLIEQEYRKFSNKKVEDVENKYRSIQNLKANKNEEQEFLTEDLYDIILKKETQIQELVFNLENAIKSEENLRNEMKSLIVQNQSEKNKNREYIDLLENQIKILKQKLSQNELSNLNSPQKIPQKKRTLIEWLTPSKRSKNENENENSSKIESIEQKSTDNRTLPSPVEKKTKRLVKIPKSIQVNEINVENLCKTQKSPEMIFIKQSVQMEDDRENQEENLNIPKKVLKKKFKFDPSTPLVNRLRSKRKIKETELIEEKVGNEKPKRGRKAKKL